MQSYVMQPYVMSFPRKGLLKKPIISQTVGATLRGCPVFMPIFRVGTETYPLHSALFQQPRKRESIFFVKVVISIFKWIPAFAGMTVA